MSFIFRHGDPIFFPIVVEAKNVKDAFLTESPWEHNVINNVPLISGIISAEDAFRAYGTYFLF